MPASACPSPVVVAIQSILSIYQPLLYASYGFSRSRFFSPPPRTAAVSEAATLPLTRPSFCYCYFLQLSIRTIQSNPISSAAFFWTHSRTLRTQELALNALSNSSPFPSFYSRSSAISEGENLLAQTIFTHLFWSRSTVQDYCSKLADGERTPPPPPQKNKKKHRV